MPCVRERQDAARPQSPEPCALIGHPLSLLEYAALPANGLRVLLLTRAWLALDNAMR
jgi:hypothetical protein